MLQIQFGLQSLMIAEYKRHRDYPSAGPLLHETAWALRSPITRMVFHWGKQAHVRVWR